MLTRKQIDNWYLEYRKWITEGTVTFDRDS